MSNEKIIENCESESRRLTCPFYEWQMEHCYHIEAKGPEVLQVFQYCFGNYTNCRNFNKYAKAPEGVAGLRAIDPFGMAWPEWLE